MSPDWFVVTRLQCTTLLYFSFFPNVVQPLVAVVSNSIYSLLVKMRICKRMVRKYDVGAPSSITISLPGTDPHDAERRR